MGTVAQNLIREILRHQVVDLPSEYAKQVLDKNHTGLIPIEQIAKDQFASNQTMLSIAHGYLKAKGIE
ncbi:MAG: hypothetical protein WAL66_07920 [Nitrososphaeraceae archaeon]